MCYEFLERPRKGKCMSGGQVNAYNKGRAHERDFKKVTFQRSYKTSKTWAPILKYVCRPNILLISRCSAL